jgi:signal transduction histidine kinase
MRLNSLAFRLLATSAAWTLLVLPLAWFFIYRLVYDDARATFDSRIEQLVAVMALDSMDTDGPEPKIPPNRFEPRFEENLSGWYWQIKQLGSDGGLTLVSPSLATGVLPSPYLAGIAADSKGQRWMTATGPDGERLRMIEVLGTFHHTGQGPQFSIIVTYPEEWIDTRVAYLMPTLGIAFGLTGLGLVAMTLLQVRFGLLPLRKIEQGLSAVRAGDATTLEGELPAEIEPLQQEINQLIKSNQDIVDRARTQVGNLAHALKTPLAVIVNEAREDRSPFALKVAEQANLMRDQISHYLDRARMAARVGIGRSTEVRPVAEALGRALERINSERGISIAIECVPGVKFQGEKQDLEEMLGNLMDNACKWAKRRVLVTATAPARDAKGEARSLVITVEDDGPGLKAEERARIGKRGLRLDETKPGSGLGLSIVTDLAQSYRGKFALDRSDLGGLLARLELPSI